MKIAEYIELVKQAETPQSGNWIDSLVESGQVESPDVISQRLSTENEPFQLERPKINPKTQLPYRNLGTGLIASEPKNPIRVKPREGGWFQIESDLPTREPNAGFRQGRTFGQRVFDYVNPEAYKDYGKHLYHESGRAVSPKGMWNDIKTFPGEAIKALNSNVKAVDLHGAFNKFVPAVTMIDTKHHIAEEATDNANKDYLDPNASWGNYGKYYWNYYLPEVGKEVYRQTPNFLVNGVSFSNPMVYPSIVSDMIWNNTFGRISPGMKGPGFYHFNPDDHRIKTDREYQSLENPEYIDPQIRRHNDQRYGWSNWGADMVGSYIDPIAQWSSVLPDILTGQPSGTWYKHNMSHLSKLLRDEDIQLRKDHSGRDVVDYQDLFGAWGTKSPYLLNGGRPEFRNNPQLKDQVIEQLKDAAALNGYTADQIEYAAEKYGRDDSLLYKDANLLEMMARDPKEIYDTPWFTNTVTDVENINGVPKHITKHVFGLPKWNGLYFEPATKTVENPKWLEARAFLQRRIADQQTLFKMSPFFAALKGSTNQLSPAEEEILNEPNKLEEIRQRAIPEVSSPSNDVAPITASLHKYDNPEYETNKLKWKNNNILRSLATLSPEDRYAFFLAYPDTLKLFLDRYYTNEETKQRIANYLGIPLDATEPKAEKPSVSSSYKQFPGIFRWLNN